MSDKKLAVKATLFGVVCGLLLTVVLMCLFAVIIITSGLLPTDITNYIMIAILSIGILFGSCVATKITKSAGLIIGLIVGFSIFILITVFGLFKNNDTITTITLIKLVASLISGALGGIIGLRKKEKIHI